MQDIIEPVTKITNKLLFQLFDLKLLYNYITFYLPMFSQFENMFKKPTEKPTFQGLVSQVTSPQIKDYSKTPQKFNINGREIQEKKLLAEGAFGFIWLAEDIRSKQQFALKRVICMTKESIQSAMREKQIMEKLPQSPHIVRYYGGLVLQKDSRTVIITLMELCPGGNLFDMLQKRQGKGISEETVKNIAQSVLKALIVLHREGIIHRDIKIQNVLVGKDKKLKICDFGSCTSEVIDFAIIPKSQYDSQKEKIQSFTTPMYRPPEIVDPYLRYKVSTKADLWMLGCTLYTMSYFVHPFVQSNAVGIAGAVFRFPSYPEETQYQVSEKMKDFIRNLLTPNPASRPTAEKMLQILGKWQDFRLIPLNHDAKRIKQEHLQKEEELKKLNRKVVEHDGDIPIQELMKIQEKLKNQSKEPFEKSHVSFVIKKESKNIKGNYQSSHVVSNRNLTEQIPQAKKTVQSKPSQSKSNSVDFWSSSFTSEPSKPQPQKKSASNFDAFGEVFSKPKQPQKQNPNSNANFYEFFASTSGVQASKSGDSGKAKNETNLLDL